MNISWPMIPGRALAKQRITDPAERERIIREEDWNLKGRKPEITPNQYWAMAKEFNPQKYDPDQWLKAAKAAGFTYAVLTTRHHEGFSLWPSAYGRFQHEELHGRPRPAEGLRRGLPPQRDQGRLLLFAARLALRPRLHELPVSAAQRKLNPEFPSLDADLKPRTTKQSPEDIAKHQAEYAALVNGQVEELLTRYGKIDLLWFDGKPAAGKSKVISQERIRELQPGIVINPRLHGHGDFVTYERTLAPKKPVQRLGRVLQHLDDLLVAHGHPVPRAGLCARPTGDSAGRWASITCSASARWPPASSATASTRTWPSSPSG